MLPKLVLASSSPRREMLLKQMGLDFTIVPSKINEKEFDYLGPLNMVNELARAKAEDVARLVEDTIVIAADTIVVYKGEKLGKPVDTDEAFEMLKRLQGDNHTVITGIAVISTNDFKTIVDNEKTLVYMRNLDDSEIKNYIASGEAMDKAGSYGIQGLGGILVNRIDGSYFNVVVLPIHKLALILKGLAVNVL